MHEAGEQLIETRQETQDQDVEDELLDRISVSVLAMNTKTLEHLQKNKKILAGNFQVNLRQL